MGLRRPDPPIYKDGEAGEADVGLLATVPLRTERQLKDIVTSVKHHRALTSGATSGDLPGRSLV